MKTPAQVRFSICYPAADAEDRLKAQWHAHFVDRQVQGP